MSWKVSWNYRVCKHKAGEETLYSIREVYYDSDDNTIFVYLDASVSNWVTPEQLRQTLKLMLEACDRPILVIDNKGEK